MTNRKGEGAKVGAQPELNGEGTRRGVVLAADALQNAIFNSANFSSIATDAKGVIQIFNVGAERMLGYAAAEVMNKITPADISDPQEVVARSRSLSLELGTEIAPGFQALAFKASRGIEDIYELTYIRKDGSRFPAVVSVTALRDAQNVIIGYLLIGTDNTARKRVEEEQKRLDERLREQNVELQSAKLAAEKANRAKSDFLSSMSHELRSPLNAILGFAQLMESDSPPPTALQKENLGQIMQAGWHLLKLISDILDLAKIESGKLSLSLEAVSLSEVMTECHGMVEVEAQRRGIELSFPSFKVASFVHADQTRLKQVLINLLSNAIKYNREAGRVEVVCTAEPSGRVRVSVRDSGAGLSSDNLEQLFEPFNRLGQEGRGQEGTGIGLVVAKQLIELMGGAIGVESVVGQGSEFWFVLKEAADPRLSASEGAAAEPVAAPSAAAVKERVVLYVEDNPANLRLVAQIISRRPDLKMLSAMTGAQGIKAGREHRPDVILMDINLPDMSGIDALRALRADPATAHIPIIAVSANAMPGNIKMGLQAGFFRYLTKPIDVKKFQETLNIALELKH
jgi:signal transduction histidine kinase/ActR/RegA family two-component response regulator